MARVYCLAYYSYLHSLEMLTDEECGRLFRAMLGYASSGEDSELCGNERFVWPMIKNQIDRDNSAYEEKCRKLRENASKSHKSAGGGETGQDE